MAFRLFLLTLTATLPLCLHAEQNPFADMVGREYAENSMELSEACHKVGLSTDDEDIEKMFSQIEAVAESTRSPQWEMEVVSLRLLQLQIRYDRKGDIPLEQLFDGRIKLLDRAIAEGITHMELRARHDLIVCYWYYTKDYERVFELCADQDRLLAKVTSEEIPEKTHYIRQIANCYYFFRDYETAGSYFQKILDEKETARNEETFFSARNGLGLCCRKHNRDLDRSDIYFRQILAMEYIEPGRELNKRMWDGIAEGNLGYNMYLRKDYGKAVPLMESSVEKVLRNKEWSDYAYASGQMITLGDIALEHGELHKARRLLDSAIVYETRMPRTGRKEAIYRSESKYYAARGNAKLSSAYMDSMMLAKESDDKEFNAMILLRNEQKINAYEQQVKTAELRLERTRANNYRATAIIAALILAIASVIAVVYRRMYRKKREAYRRLAEEAEIWALKQEASTLTKKKGKGPTEEDRDLISHVHDIMGKGKLYKDAELTLDGLADRMKINRNTLSKAVNSVTGKNFNQFVNDYRISEAIRIISSRKPSDIYINELYEEVGFNSRTPFYLAFKQATGLSPTDFIKNKKP